MPKRKIVENPLRTYRKIYRVRFIGGGYSISVPVVLVERKAREHKMEIEEFLKKYDVEVMFDDFPDVDGVFTFKRKEDGSR